MIAVSRIDFGLDYSQHSRYTSVSVLVSLPLLVIVGTVVHSFAARHWRKLAVASRSPESPGSRSGCRPRSRCGPRTPTTR